MKYFINVARCFASLGCKTNIPIHAANLFAVWIATRTFFALDSSSCIHSLLRHSAGRIFWKKVNSRMVSCRASSTGDISVSWSVLPDIRGRRGAGGDRRPPETIRRLPGSSPRRWDVSFAVGMSHRTHSSLDEGHQCPRQHAQHLPNGIHHLLSGEALQFVQHVHILVGHEVNIEPGTKNISDSGQLALHST